MGFRGGDMNYFLLFTLLFALSIFSTIPQAAHAEAFEHSSIKKHKKSDDMTADRGSEHDPYKDLHKHDYNH